MPKKGFHDYGDHRSMQYLFKEKIVGHVKHHFWPEWFKQ